MTKQGAGILTLTGNNTHSGGTTISAGTLQIGNGGSTGSIGGIITNNAALVFNRNDAYTFGGVINGAGSVTVQGGGTLTLSSISAASSYSGSTTLNGGSLTINPGVGVSQTSSVSVTNGTLKVNGTLGSSSTVTTINSGGTLGGSGTINGSVTVANGGTLAPGNSPNVMTFTNGFTISPGGNFEVEILGPNPGNGTVGYDQALVTGGNVNISGANLLLPSPGGSGYSPSSVLWIVNNTGTGTLTGEFSGLSNGAELTALNGLPGTGTGSWNIHYGANFSTSALTGGNDIAIAFTPAPVPEPGSVLAIGAVGLGLFGVVRRRRKKSAEPAVAA